MQDQGAAVRRDEEGFLEFFACTAPLIASVSEPHVLRSSVVSWTCNVPEHRQILVEGKSYRTSSMCLLKHIASKYTLPNCHGEGLRLWTAQHLSRRHPEH